MEKFDFTVSSVVSARRKVYSPKQSLNIQGRKYNGLTLVLSGELKLTFPDKDAVLAKENDIILQRRGDYYRLEALDKAEYIVISYLAEPESVLFSLLPESRIFTPLNRIKFINTFEQAVATQESFCVFGDTLLRALVQEIICNIVQEIYPASQSSTLPVQSAKFYIDEFYDRELKMEDVASVAGFSVSHLRMIFKKTYGQSPLRYLNSVRVEHAKEMLESKLFTLEEVATACGFQNVYYFSKVFKAITGITPGKYGKKQR